MFVCDSLDNSSCPMTGIGFTVLYCSRCTSTRVGILFVFKFLTRMNGRARGFNWDERSCRACGVLCSSVGPSKLFSLAWHHSSRKIIGSARLGRPDTERWTPVPIGEKLLSAGLRCWLQSRWVVSYQYFCLV
ncbi:unnamed protein product [Ectocarpus sp. 8 AP-2014]